MLQLKLSIPKNHIWPTTYLGIFHDDAKTLSLKTI